ncbi:hypothetical protein NDU88_000231 [Pleurodeles waltl]|uniref:Uncharacterized protein n=1 Tax=Pleurodeles waltl TaxID=8319 RepID=A0AAV7R9E4_PLEWA|nr:hypothetical protein NDU88_000231 [Pleurodeles waltl]
MCPQGTISGVLAPSDSTPLCAHHLRGPGAIAQRPLCAHHLWGPGAIAQRPLCAPKGPSQGSWRHRTAPLMCPPSLGSWRHRTAPLMCPPSLGSWRHRTAPLMCPQGTISGVLAPSDITPLCAHHLWGPGAIGQRPLCAPKGPSLGSWRHRTSPPYVPTISGVLAPSDSAPYVPPRDHLRGPGAIGQRPLCAPKGPSLGSCAIGQRPLCAHHVWGPAPSDSAPYVPTMSGVLRHRTAPLMCPARDYLWGPGALAARTPEICAPRTRACAQALGGTPATLLDYSYSPIEERTRASACKCQGLHQRQLELLDILTQLTYVHPTTPAGTY